MRRAPADPTLTDEDRALGLYRKYETRRKGGGRFGGAYYQRGKKMGTTVEEARAAARAARARLEAAAKGIPKAAPAPAAPAAPTGSKETGGETPTGAGAPAAAAAGASAKAAETVKPDAVIPPAAPAGNGAPAAPAGPPRRGFFDGQAPAGAAGAQEAEPAMDPEKLKRRRVAVARFGEIIYAGEVGGIGLLSKFVFKTRPAEPDEVFDEIMPEAIGDVILDATKSKGISPLVVLVFGTLALAASMIAGGERIPKEKEGKLVAMDGGKTSPKGPEAT